MDLKDAIQKYIGFLAAIQKSMATINNYDSAFRQFVGFTGNMPVSELGPRHAKSFMVELGTRGLAPSTVKARMAAITGFYEYVVDTWGPLIDEEGRHTYMTNDHIQAMRRWLKNNKPKPKKRVPRVPNEAHVQTVRQYAHQRAADRPGPFSSRNVAILEMLLCTGCRRSEVAALKWDDVDQVNRVAIVRGKGDKERVVPLSRQAMDTMERYAREWAPKNDGAVFQRHNSLGKRPAGQMSPESVGNILDRLCLGAGVPAITAHQYRHRAGQIIVQGAGLEMAKEIMGHEKIETTMVYTDMQSLAVQAAHRLQEEGKL